MVHVSIFAQTRGQVTLSIKLYPVQIIELNNQTAHTIKLDNLDNEGDSNELGAPSLSTYSTTHFVLQVDTLQNKPHHIHTHRHNDSSNTPTIKEQPIVSATDEWHIMYSIKTL